MFDGDLVPIAAPRADDGVDCSWKAWKEGVRQGAPVLEGSAMAELRATDRKGRQFEIQIPAPCSGVVESLRRLEVGARVRPGDPLGFVRVGAAVEESGAPVPEDPLPGAVAPDADGGRSMTTEPLTVEQDGDLPPEHYDERPAASVDPYRTVQPSEPSRPRGIEGSGLAPPDSPRPVRGLRIPGYELREQLGSGASGTVHLAIDTSTRQRCVLKVFHEKPILDQEWHCTELIRARVPLQYHDQFVLLERLVPADGAWVARMPYEPWRSLDKLIMELREHPSSPPTAPQVRSLLDGLCSAAGRLHGASIIHRDLKPSNIFVLFDRNEDQVRIKISDFTVCYMTEMDAGRAHKVELRTAGTQEYLPPEARLRDPAAPDRRWDIYSIGVIAYEFSCLRLPTLNDSLPSAERDEEQLEWLDEFFARATKRWPEDRPSNVGELVRLLRGTPAAASAPRTAESKGKAAQSSESLLSNGLDAARHGRTREAESLFRAAGEAGHPRGWRELAELTWRERPRVALDACDHALRAERQSAGDLEWATCYRAILNQDRATLAGLAQGHNPLARLWHALLEQFEAVDLAVPVELRASSRWNRTARLPWRIRHRVSGVEMILVAPDLSDAVPQPYFLGVTTVSQGEWRRALPPPPGLSHVDDAMPVNGISWEQSKELAAALRLRLPTSAEWELACRCGTTTPFSFGGTLPETHANCNRAGAMAGQRGAPAPRLAPAASAEPNAWGFVHMHGNVWEWCEDELAGSPGNRVRRGGSYADPPERCTSASVDSGPQDRRGWVLVGVRLAWTPPAH